MNKKTITIAVLMFVAIVLGMFTYAYLKKSELESVVDVPQQNEAEEFVQERLSYIDRIDAKYFFSDGTHTLVGEIPMPTPCDLLVSEAEVAESFPEQVVVDFGVINNSDDCTQVITPQRFKTEFTASSDAVISARLEGRTVDLNLIPAGPGESPEDFELFIKG